MPMPESPAMTAVPLLPEGWPRPRGYSNGMLAPKGRLIVTGGVVGWNAEERFAEGFVPQFRQVLENIVAILSAAGAKPAHLIRMTWYVTDIPAYVANLREVGAVYRAIIGPVYPAMAVIGVSRLVEPAAMIEIEAMAVLPD